MDDSTDWLQQLTEYEQIEENMLKFGPVDLTDPAALHSAFGTFASSRILRGEQSAGEDSDGSQESEGSPNWGAERDPDCTFPELEQILSDIGSDFDLSGARRLNSILEMAPTYDGASIVPDAS